MVIFLNLSINSSCETFMTSGSSSSFVAFSVPLGAGKALFLSKLSPKLILEGVGCSGSGSATNEIEYVIL